MTKFIYDEENPDMLDGILQPNGHYRVPMFLRDNVTINPVLNASQRAVVGMRQHDAATFDGSLYKPGPRYSTNHAAANDAAAKRDAAYEEYQRYITDAWKSKAPPAGSYPAANGANEGDACTINGAPGKLRAIAGHDGYLECRSTDKADHSNDSRSIQNDAQSAQAIKDAAYAEYDLRMENSWRNQS